MKKFSQWRKKLKGDPLEFFPENKSLTKKGDSLVSSDIVLRGKKQKPIGFSSLGQQIQIGALKFCRTFGRTILVTSGVSKKNTDEKP